MLMKLGQLRHYVAETLLREINANMMSRLVNVSTFVIGLSYDGNKFIAALNTEALQRGKVDVLGTVEIVPVMPMPIEGGKTIKKPWKIDNFTASTPAVSVALMSITLNWCKAVVPSNNISPAARKFLLSYYERNKNDPSKMARIAPKGSKHQDYITRYYDQDVPALSSVYFADGSVDVDDVFARGKTTLKQAAKLRKGGLKALNDEIFTAQEDKFADAYNSLQSGREVVKTALSDGPTTFEKLKATLNIGDMSKIQSLIDTLPRPITDDAREWFDERNEFLKRSGIIVPADLLSTSSVEHKEF